jgi:hypothetical protein
MFPLVGKTVLATVQLNIEFRLLAKEIQVVNTDGMLTTEFVAGKTPGTQPAPDQFFRPRFNLAKLPGAFNVGHDGKLENDGKNCKVSFDARPLPEEKESPMNGFLFLGWLPGQSSFSKFEVRRGVKANFLVFSVATIKCEIDALSLSARLSGHL